MRIIETIFEAFIEDTLESSEKRKLTLRAVAIHSGKQFKCGKEAPIESSYSIGVRKLSSRRPVIESMLRQSSRQSWIHSGLPLGYG